MILQSLRPQLHFLLDSLHAYQGQYRTFCESERRSVVRFGRISALLEQVLHEISALLDESKAGSGATGQAGPNAPSCSCSTSGKLAPGAQTVPSSNGRESALPVLPIAETTEGIDRPRPRKSSWLGSGR